MDVNEPIRKAGISFQALRKFLGIPVGSSILLTQHMKALGIVLEPFKRDDGVVRRQYKKKKRPLTEEEAARVIARVRAFQGRDEK